MFFRLARVFTLKGVAEVGNHFGSSPIIGIFRNHCVVELAIGVRQKTLTLQTYGLPPSSLPNKFVGVVAERP